MAGFLFDLDGVIIDSEKQYSKIWIQINKEYPTGIPDLEIKIKGMTLDKILKEYYQDEDLREKVKDRLYELESKIIYSYKDSALDFLKRLKKLHLPTALVTSSNRVKMEKLKETIPDIENWFDYIVTSESITKSKPDPEGYLLASKKLNIDPKKCVIFEDSLQGVMAGKNSGAFVIGVKGTIPQDKLIPYSDLLISGFDEINLQNLINLLSNR